MLSSPDLIVVELRKANGSFILLGDWVLVNIDDINGIPICCNNLLRLIPKKYGKLKPK
jgi:hypothetical protein